MSLRISPAQHACAVMTTYKVTLLKVTQNAAPTSHKGANRIYTPNVTLPPPAQRALNQLTI